MEHKKSLICIYPSISTNLSISIDLGPSIHPAVWPERFSTWSSWQCNFLEGRRIPGGPVEGLEHWVTGTLTPPTVTVSSSRSRSRSSHSPRTVWRRRSGPLRPDSCTCSCRTPSSCRWARPQSRSSASRSLVASDRLRLVRGGRRAGLVGGAEEQCYLSVECWGMTAWPSHPRSGSWIPWRWSLMRKEDGRIS